MLKFVWYLLWTIQALLITAKVFGIIAISWWGVLMPFLLIVGVLVLCVAIAILFAWAIGSIHTEDYE